MEVGPLNDDFDPIDVLAGGANPPWLAAARRKEREYAEKTKAAEAELTAANDEAAALLAEFTRYGHAASVATRRPTVIQAFPLFTLARQDATWCAGCDRITMACWTCDRGIAIPVIEPDEAGP